MTGPKVIFRIALGSTGVSILCALGFLFMGVTSFAAVYLIELSPSLRNVGSVEDAVQLFDSVCMTFPQSMVGVLPAVLCSPEAGG